MRVLGRIRLSRTTEESTSAARQKEIIETWAKQNDHTVIGFAEDLDVSGAVDPFDTPALGPWLTEPKLHEWDILCSWKLDRLARRAVPLHRLFGLCQEEGKTLVCVSDNIDLSHWVGRLVASVIAGVAEGELEAIRERIKSSQAKLRELGRFAGGKVAYGYRAQPREDAAGWELVLDEKTSPVMLEIVHRVSDGQSVESVARDLTERGIPSPSGGDRWPPQTIFQLLRSKTLLGHVTHKGETVRDAEGLPVHKGPPLIDRDLFDKLQASLASRRNTNIRSKNTSPLLGVAVCGVCGKSLHFRSLTNDGKFYSYYRCTNVCGRQMPAPEMEARVEEGFLHELGDRKAQERLYVPSEDHQAELDEAVRAVDEISQALGTAKSDIVRTRLQAQLSALDNRISELESLPATEARWAYQETGQTYRELWEANDSEGRRQLLLRSGITAAVTVTKGTQAVEFDFRVPPDLLERLSV